jgi:phage terminase large subunit GpA-like protein
VTAIAPAELDRAARNYEDAFAEGIRPDPISTVSEWADANRYLGPDSGSVEPGLWRTSRTPYLREIMDMLGPSSAIQRVVFMKAARVGATEAGNNWIGFIMDRAPGPVLMVCPTDADAGIASKERIAPMIRSTPALRNRVADNRSRDGTNTILMKEFTGGRLAITGANSARGLGSRTFRYLFPDEIDRYPEDVDGEGDPLKLAEVRTTTYEYTRKIFEISSPTKKGRSRIEKEFKKTDQRRYFVPCPWCGHMDYITWDGKDWLGGLTGLHHRINWDEGQPETAHLLCSGCSKRVDERWKQEMLEKGEWRATAEPQRQDMPTVGYHISALYSPWQSWSSVAGEFYVAKDDPPLFQVWVNTRLGETWEDRDEAVDVDVLLGRRERFAAQVPAGVGILVASIDNQATWLEVKVKGYGAGEESWLIDWTRIEGDPLLEKSWLDVDKFLRTEFIHASGRVMHIECVTVDAGGKSGVSDRVYQFCRAREARRLPGGAVQYVYAVRGGQTTDEPIVGRPTNSNAYRAKLFTLCVDTAKAKIYSRLRIPAAGPGYMHLPEWTDTEYLEQLTAEKVQWKSKPRGGRVRTWKQTRARNEALDLEVYCLAALYILGPSVIRNLPARAAAFAKPPEGTPPAPPEKQPPQKRALTGAPKGGWMSRVKK